MFHGLSPAIERRPSKSADEQFPLMNLAEMNIRHKRILKRRVPDIMDSIFYEDELQSESDSLLNIPSASFTPKDCSESTLLLNYILITTFFMKL
jgi:hypothetical protein